MCRNHAQYAVLEDDFLREQPLIIKDIGHANGCPSVTNDVEHVVEVLKAGGHLPDGRRLFYRDSENELAEILLEGGRFAGFAPVPQRQLVPTACADCKRPVPFDTAGLTWEKARPRLLQLCWGVNDETLSALCPDCMRPDDREEKGR